MNAPGSTASPVARRCIRARHVVVVVVAVVVLWLAWFVYSVLTAKPGPLVDYRAELVALSAAAQPEGENGWPILMEALKRFEAIDMTEVPGWPTEKSEIDMIRNFELVRTGPYRPDAYHRERLYLEAIRDAGVFDLIAEAASKPRAVREDLGPIDESLIGILLPELSPSRRVVRARAASVRIGLNENDFDDTVSAVAEMFGLGRMIAHVPSVISWLVGQSVHSQVLEELRMTMGERYFSEPEARRLLDMLDTSPPLPDLTLGLEGERRIILDIIQRTHTRRGLFLPREFLAFNPDVFLPLPGIESDSGLVNFYGFLFPRGNRTTRLAQTYYDSLVERARLDRENRKQHPFDADAFFATVGFRQVVLRFMLPALERTLSSRDVYESHWQATRIVLALAMHYARHGHYPSTLDALAPDFLAEVPLDPIVGRPFGYRLREPGEDDPRPYLLYSIGLDLTDDGGRELPSDGDLRPDSVLTQRGPETAGYDYIFNRLRPAEP